MARPKLYKNPRKITLTTDLKTKRQLFRMATDRGISLSQLVVRLADEENKREQQAA